MEVNDTHLILRTFNIETAEGFNVCLDGFGSQLSQMDD
jgi:hypothetical protein